MVLTPLDIKKRNLVFILKSTKYLHVGNIYNKYINLVPIQIPKWKPQYYKENDVLPKHMPESLKKQIQQSPDKEVRKNQLL